MSQSRYIYREEPLSPAEARKRRKRQQASIRSEIEEKYEEIRELERELYTLSNSPLDTHTKVCVTLNPGDPGYEAAPVTGFRMVTDEGARKFIHLQTP